MTHITPLLIEKFKHSKQEFHHVCAFIGDETFMGDNDYRKKGMPVSCHAEINVLRKILKKYGRNIKRPMCFDVVVIRISKSGKIGESRPCYHCIQTMLLFCEIIKIKNVFYSTSDGTIVQEKLVDMLGSPKTTTSTGWRHRTGKSKYIN